MFRFLFTTKRTDISLYFIWIFKTTMEEKELQGGCLWDGATDSDYRITGEMIDNLPKLEIQDQIIFEYDQSWTPDCTIYSALWALSDLFNRELTQEQIDEAVEESFNRWRTRGGGRYTKEAVNLACDMRMKWYPNEKVVYYRINNRWDDEIKEVIEKNYSLCTSFNGNSSYQKDRKDNGRIDNSHTWPFTYWHAVCLIEREGKKFVKDNYKGRKENGYFTNIYEVVPEISTLRRDGCWHNFSYLIVKVKDEKEEDIKRLNNMKNLIDKIDEHSDILIPTNSEMWENTNDKEYQEQLHIVNEALRKLKDMNEKKRTDIERELSRYFD